MTAIDYIPVVVMLGFAAAASVVIVFLSHIIGRRKPNPVKQDFYECGVPPLVSHRMRFHIRFFVIALLFLIFDFETVALLPWAISYKSLLAAHGWALPLISILIFLGVLVVGFVYELAKGAIKWE
jgi:NADH-quinone oxidoreductase subunit A